MPRQNPKLILAATRVAEARRIVGDQRALIAKLQANGDPTADAEKTLATYESALKHLEGYEQKLRSERRAKRGETKKPR
jgi:hypothetical protein